MLSFKTFFLKNFQRTTQFLLFLGVFISTTFVFNVSPASAAVTSWNCSSYDGPIFIENENNAAEARELNLSSESYGSIIFSIPYSQNGRGWSYSQLNGIAINPVDGEAYGVMGGVSGSHSKFLVRFDDNDVEFIAKVSEANTSATIDVHGDYIFIGDGNYGLYRIENVANLAGYSSPTNNSILDKTGISTLLSGSDNNWGGGIADIQAIRADLDLGGVEDYVVGIRNSNSGGTKVTVARYSGSTDVWHLTPSETLATRPWRAAWYTDGQLIFQEKKGNIYGVDLTGGDDIDLSGGNAEVTELGDTGNIKDGDGMSCFDIPGFTVAQTGSTVVSETGTTDTFTVVLDAKPAGNVNISLTNPDTGEATLSTTSLTFSTSNWSTPQTVTVTGVDDLYVDSDQNQTVTLSVEDSGTNDVIYEGVANQTVTVTTQDNENAGFTVTQSSGSTTVNEGGSTDTFTVVLTARPLTDVEIDVSSADLGEAAVSPASLTFTTNNWNTAQTVTVTGVDDSDIDGNQTTNISLVIDQTNSADSYDNVASQAVSATTEDDDTVGYTVVESGGSTSVSESGSTDTFTVVLNGQPSSNVVFDITSADTGEATVSTGSLTFTSSNWNTAQTVTVTGVDDTIIDGNQNSTLTVSVNDGSSDNNFDALGDQTVTAATADNDAAGYEVIWPSLDGESPGASEPNGTQSFQVKLSVQPNSDVVMNIVSSDTGEATVSTGSLTFTSSNWNTPQTVTVTGVDDTIIDGNQNVNVTVSVNDGSSDNNFDPLNDSVHAFVIEDDDSAGFTVAHTGGNTTVTEAGSTDTFTVVLDAQPNSNVVLGLAFVGSVDEATFNKSTLTFTNGNWNTPQTVTVTGVDDSLVDGNQNSTITTWVVTGSSDDNFDSLSAENLIVATTDNDVAGFTIAETGGNTTVTEAGSTDTFTVVLNAQPDSNVVLTITSADTGESTVTSPLTFTNGNWNTPQTVTVTGVNDTIIDGNQNSILTIAVDDGNSDNNFDPLNNQTVTAITTDNDVAGFTIAETGGNTTVTEAGSTDTFTIVLDAQPASDVALIIYSNDAGEATVTSSLTFTSGNWNTPQTVTVTGVDDNLIDGTQSKTIDIAINDNASDNDFDNVAPQSVSVSISDNDTAGFTVAETGGNTTVTEAGSTDTFTVVLNAQPDSNVVLTITSADTGESTVTSPLTFTNGNWNTPQTVTVTGVNDTIIDGNQNSILTIAVDDGNSDNNFDPLNNQTVTAITTDNDVAGFTIVESGGSTAVNEGGSTDTFTVVLNAQPDSNVVLTITSADTGESTVTSPLTFTNGNWNTPQTVTVTGVDENLVDGDQTVVFTVEVVDGSSDDAYDNVPDQTVNVINADNDSAGFTVVETGGNTTVTEAGSTDTFTVILSQQPSSNVVLTVVSGDTGESTVSTGTLTFTNGNWNTAQTITVTGADDSIIDGNQNSTITISVDDANSDNNFDPLNDQTVIASTTDDDVVGFTIVESGGSTAVNEGGSTDTFTVVLDTQPASDVVLTITSADTGESTVTSSLTFTNGNWNTPQTVTVTGVNDSLVDGDQTVVFTVEVVDGSSDDAYDNVPDQTVNVINADNETAGFTITETGGNTTVTEAGSTDTFTVVLNAQPMSNVVLTITSADTGESTVTSSLTFTNGNWNTPQTVTVTGVNDNLVDGNKNSTITIAVDDGNSDNNFDPLNDQTVTATTTDDDTAGFTIAETGGNTTVTEAGSTDTFTVVLNAQPDSNVVLTITSADTGESTVTSPLTFTNGNWFIPQVVTVTGVDDNLIDGNKDSTLTIAVDDANSDNNFDPVNNQTVTATTTDNDTAGFTIAETGGNTTVTEAGSTDTFTVVLNAQPDSNVVLTITSADTGESTVTSPLTFTNGNWNTPQTVTVTGVNDNLVDGDVNSVLTIAVDDGNSDNNFDPLNNQTVTATTTDNETAGFTIAETGGNTTVTEAGSTDTFTVVLNAQPDSDVVLIVSSSDVGEVRATTTLTFTNGNWNTPQTVTVTGSDDVLNDGDQITNVTVSVNAANSDNNFDPVSAQVVEVTTIDDDSASFSIEQTEGSTIVSEDLDTDTFTVVLDVQPSANVSLQISQSDNSESTLQTSTLTFTPQNWNTPQNVTITGVDDEIADGDQSGQIQVSVNTNSSSEFSGLSSQYITVTTLDNENDLDGDGLEDANDPCPNDEDCDDDTVLDPDEEIGCVKTPDCDGDTVLDPDEEPGCAIIIDCDGDTVLDPDEEPSCAKIPDCDGDGLLDNEELEGCILDPDCDDDGLTDNQEPEECILDPDCDDDGVLDGAEPAGCILDPDCDDDGVLDGAEPAGCILDPDCDDDGIIDSEEKIQTIGVIARSCVLIPDCDNDGLLDGEEIEECILDPDCDDDGLTDNQEPEECILDPDCDDDGIIDGEEEIIRVGVIVLRECMLFVDCDDDGLPDGEEPAACIIKPDCDNGGLLDGEEPEGCVQNPFCGEKELLTPALSGPSESTTTTSEDPSPTTNPPTTTEGITIQLVVASSETDTTKTLIIGIGIGIGALLFLSLLLFLIRRKLLITSIIFHSGEELTQIKEFMAIPSGTGPNGIIQQFKIYDTNKSKLKNIYRLFSTNFMISFINENPSEISLNLSQNITTSNALTFMTSRIPIPQKDLEEIELAGPQATNLHMPQSQTTSITWTVPSRNKPTSSYHLEGLTNEKNWKLITEVSIKQTTESKALLEIEEYTHVRLRPASNWSFTRPSFAIPVGTIRFSGIKEKS